MKELPPITKAPVEQSDPKDYVESLFNSAGNTDFPKILGTVDVVDPETYIKGVFEEKKVQKNYDLTKIFRFSDFTNFKQNDLLYAKEPTNPYCDDLHNKIDQLLALQKSVISAEEGSKFALIVSCLFMNGLREKSNLIKAIDKLGSYYPDIKSIVNDVKKFEKPSYQAQIFTNLLLNRGFFKLVLNVIRDHENWIDKYYMQSSLMKYGNTLNTISDEFDRLGILKFTLTTSAVDDDYLNYYSQKPAYEFVDIAFSNDIVASLIEILDECQKKRLIKNFVGNDTWRFIDEIYATRQKEKEKEKENQENNNQNQNEIVYTDKALYNKYLNMFLNDVSIIRGSGFMDYLKNQSRKLEQFMRRAYDKKVIDIYFLILVVHNDIAKRYFEPSSIITDFYRAKYVASYLAFSMEKLGRQEIKFDDENDND